MRGRKTPYIIFNYFGCEVVNTSHLIMNVLDDVTVELLCERIGILALRHFNEHNPKERAELKKWQDENIAMLRALGVLKIDVSKC